MKFKELPLKGAFVIEPEMLKDERGFFARTFCTEEFAAHGISPDVIQCNVSFNKLKGTLRGMHYQLEPHGEAKLVRCTKGAIYDVIIDLRPDSETYMSWISEELNENNYKMLFIPRGFAHGFQSLHDDTEVFYQMSNIFVPQAARGIKWNDPAFNIKWPLAPTVISQKDKSYPEFNMVTV